MTDQEITVIRRDLPVHIKGFVVLGSDFAPCIILNSRHSVEQQKKTYLHELNHIQNGDMENTDYHEYEGLSWAN